MKESKPVRVRKGIYDFLVAQARKHPLQPSITYLISLIVWEWAEGKNLLEELKEFQEFREE